MKIRTKIFWSAFIPGAILIAIAIIIFFRVSANNLESQIKSHLQTVANERAEHIETFLTQNEDAVNLLTKGFTFKRFLSTDKNSPEYEEFREETTQRLLDIVNTKEGIISSYLLDKNGISVASSDESRCLGSNTCLGADRSGEDIFIEAKKGFYIKDLYRAEDNSKEVVLNMSTSVSSGDEFLGVVVVKINPDKLYRITSTGISHTEGGEEVYLVNSNHYVITPLKGTSDSVLKKKIETLNVKNCFSALDVEESQYLSYKDVKHTGHEATEIFTGYNGAETIGSHAYMPIAKWCLLVESSKKEAFVSINSLLTVAWSLTFFIFLFSLIFSFVIGKILAKPIEKLHEGAEVISKGNLGYKVSIKTKDEIGELSRAFDAMTDAIKKSREDIDRKVEEQTKELKEHQLITKKAKERAERINKVMVGREMKMIELKKELEKTKKAKK